MGFRQMGEQNHERAQTRAANGPETRAANGLETRAAGKPVKSLPATIQFEQAAERANPYPRRSRLARHRRNMLTKMR